MIISRSLTLRILIINFLVLALPILIDSFVFFQKEYDEALKEAKQQVRDAANFRAFTLTEVQPTRQLILNELETFLKLDDPDTLAHPDRLSQTLAAAANAVKDIVELRIYVLQKTQEGHYHIVASSNPNSDEPSPFTDDALFYWPIKQGEGYFGRYVYSTLYHRYVPLMFRVKVIHSTDSTQPTTLLVVSSMIDTLVHVVLTERTADHHMQFAILSAEGVVLMASHDDLVGRTFDPIPATRQKEILERRTFGLPFTKLKPITILKKSGTGFVDFIFNDEIQIGYRAYWSEYSPSLIAYVPKKSLLNHAIHHFLWIYIVYSLLLIIGGGITYWSALLLSRPLQQLTHLMEAVREGNLEMHFQPHPFGGEINVLGKIFNETLSALVHNMAQAEEEHVKIQTARHELAIGRQVQQGLFPKKMPSIPGIDLAARYVAASDVGGDFYGYISRLSQSGEPILYINIADASGKGISSCLYALSARSLLRSFVVLIDDPGTALSRANNAFIDYVGDSGMFVTMCSAVYHCESKLLSYYSCGHIPPIIRRSSGELVTFEVSGIAIGLSESTAYVSQSMQLYSGDLVLFYTNGVIEAVNEQNQVFSLRRLHRYLKKGGWLTAQAVIEGLLEEIDAFTDHIEQTEEMTMVVLKVD